MIQAFGTDAGSFSAYRFLMDPGLLKSKSWRPFGGGSTFCPGRFMTRREISMFIALALNRFEMKLAELPSGGRTQKFPEMDDSIPWGGIVHPIPGDDVFVVLRQLPESRG